MIVKHKMAKGKVRVTFTMPALDDVTQLYLVGDFNNWSIAETPLKQTGDGTWSTTLMLDGGRQYAYRYFANGQTWHNDWAADSYIPNTFGSENSVIDLMETEAAVADTAAAPPKRATAARKKAR